MVAPFITAQPLRQFASLLDSSNQPEISLLTNLAVDSLLQGSVDGSAIAQFCREVPTTTLRHLPGLHAKAYVADEHTAIVTSGNLTSGSLHRNYEYGIRISEPSMVRKVADDLLEFGDLGVRVTLEEMDHLAQVATTLRERHTRAVNSAQASLRREFENELENAHESLLKLRGVPGESANSIFARTIVYLLRNGSLSTRELHPLVQNIHPDLCNDDLDRTINGVHFGKEWKHRVRGAQVVLRRRGVIDLVDGKWFLVGTE